LKWRIVETAIRSELERLDANNRRAMNRTLRPLSLAIDALADFTLERLRVLEQRGIEIDESLILEASLNSIELVNQLAVDLIVKVRERRRTLLAVRR